MTTTAARPTAPETRSTAMTAKPRDPDERGSEIAVDHRVGELVHVHEHDRDGCRDDAHDEGARQQRRVAPAPDRQHGARDAERDEAEAQPGEARCPDRTRREVVAAHAEEGDEPVEHGSGAIGQVAQGGDVAGVAGDRAQRDVEQLHPEVQDPGGDPRDGQHREHERPAPAVRRHEQVDRRDERRPGRR